MKRLRLPLLSANAMIHSGKTKNLLDPIMNTVSQVGVGLIPTISEIMHGTNRLVLGKISLKQVHKVLKVMKVHLVLLSPIPHQLSVITEKHYKTVISGFIQKLEKPSYGTHNHQTLILISGLA